jgi:CelD/BcsL family acetyltransferase involved in cellulose biosynthesis
VFSGPLLQEDGRYNGRVLRTEVLTSPESLGDLADSWREIAESSPRATPFQTPEWQLTWWRHFGRGKSLRHLAFYEGRDLIGAYPLCVSRGPWRTLRAAGHGASDYLHPLARASHEKEVADAVSEWIGSVKGVDLVDLHQVREDQALIRTMTAHAEIEQARCLLLDLPSTYADYLTGLSKSLRYDVKRLDRELFTSGRAKIVTVGPHNLEEGMRWLFETHKKRWRKRGLPGAFLGRLQAFHRDWAAAASQRGYLRLSALTVDNEPVGAIYAMALGDAFYFYQAGFDPAKSSISPGSLLVAHTVRQAIEEGKTRFDFLRGDEPYKRRWKPQRVFSNLRLIRAITPIGQSGLAWNNMGSTVERRVRQRLEGRGLI